jgi:DNA invertase Pin-like site-specific DNA recombinase
MSPRVAIFVRESPGHDLSGAEQEAILRDLCARRGWTVSIVYRQRASARDGRAVRDAMLGNAGTRFHRIVACSLCRIGRSLPELMATLVALRERGVSVMTAEADGFDAAPVMDATAVLPLPALEAARRSWHRERVVAGKARARARGVVFGRPRVPETKIQKVRDALKAGLGIRPTARIGGVGAVQPGQNHEPAAGSVAWVHIDPVLGKMMDDAMTSPATSAELRKFEVRHKRASTELRKWYRTEAATQAA